MKVMHELGSLRMHVVSYEAATWKKERSEKGLCCCDTIKGAPSTFARVSLSSPQDWQTVKRSPPSQPCKGEEQWIPPWHQEDWVMPVQAINAALRLENVWRVEEIIEETNGDVSEAR